MVCSLDRLGWKVVDATNLVTDEGRAIDLCVTPPVVVKRKIEDAVRRWRWRNVARSHPSLQEGCNFEPIFKLLGSKKNDSDWNAPLRGMLRSVVTNREVPAVQVLPSRVG